MQPSIAGRHLVGEHRQSGADEAGRLAPVPDERRTHQHRRDLFGAGLKPRCPVDAAPRTSLRRSQQNHQKAPEFRIGRSTPRRAIRPTKLPPRARRTSRQRAHVSSGTYGALSPRRQPSSAVLFFGGDLPLSWRIGRDRPPVRRVQLDLDTRCRYPTPVLPLPRLPTRLLWAEEEKRFLQLSRGGVNRLRTGCFLSFRNDLTRGFDSLFSGHTGQYGGSDTN